MLLLSDVLIETRRSAQPIETSVIFSFRRRNEAIVLGQIRVLVARFELAAAFGHAHGRRKVRTRNGVKQVLLLHLGGFHAKADFSSIDLASYGPCPKTNSRKEASWPLLFMRRIFR
jgi:hypothetical protein